MKTIRIKDITEFYELNNFAWVKIILSFMKFWILMIITNVENFLRARLTTHYCMMNAANSHTQK